MDRIRRLFARKLKAEQIYINGDQLDATAAELDVLSGVTAGTVTASKAVVVDSNKDAGDFRNLDAVNIDAGASGTAGSVDVFPAAASRGKLALTCTNQTGDTTVTVNADAMGQATTVHVPDPGAAASYVVQSTAAITLSEANVLDGATAGTAVASKALVADASIDITGLRNVGATGTGTFGALAGADAALNIDGQAGSGGSAGGTVVIQSGAGHTNGAGGVASVTGGTGAGTGNGGAASLTGGRSGAGATGNGGAASVTGGAAASTAGDGGAASLTGGVATGTGTGGGVTLTSGASAGAGGTAGSIGIDTGAAAGGTGGTISIGTTNATSVSLGRAAGTVTLRGTALTATATEIDTLAGVTPGTVTAGKAVVTTTDKHIDALVISDGGLALGAGAGTAISATAAEINKLDGAPLAATFVIGAEGGNVINVAIQLQDANAVDLAVRGAVRAYLSNDANGDSLATTAPSGGTVIGTDGVAIPITPALTNALLVDGNLAIDSVPEKFQTTQTAAFLIGGVSHTKAATAALTFTAAHVITASKFGIILVQINAAGTISTKVPLATQAYDNAPAALAALPSPDAGNVSLGYIAIENNAGDWTANTDDLTNGSDVTTAAFTDSSETALGAAKAWELVSEADGDIDLNITEAAAATWYLVLVLPNGKLVASTAITFT